MFIHQTVHHIIMFHCIRNVINDLILNLPTLKDVYNLFDGIAQTPGQVIEIAVLIYVLFGR